MDNAHDSADRTRSARAPFPAAQRPRRALLRDFSRMLLLAVVVPVLLIGALHVWQGARVARDQYAQRLADTAEATAREIDTFIGVHRAALQVLAERRTAEGSLDDRAAWTRDLERLHRHYPDFHSLALIDRGGAIVMTEPASSDAAGSDVADRSYYREPRRTGQPYVSDAYQGRVIDEMPSAAIAAPVFEGGRFAGVVGGAIGIDAFPSLQRSAAQTRGFELMLVDRQHTVINATSGLPHASLHRLAATGPDADLRALEASGTRTGMRPLPGVLRDGADAYGIAVPLRSGWRLVVLVPESAVVAELRRNTAVMLGLIVLLLAGVLAIVGWQMRRVGSDVRGLLGRMQRFALESEPLPDAPGDLPPELAPLADALDRLARRAHEAYEDVSLSLDEQRRLREELQAMAGRLLTVQEDERRTLSRELHDDIGQAITAIKLGAMAVQDDPDPERRREVLAEIIATTDQTIAKLRNLSMLLRPPQLDTLGLETALRWQAETLFRSGRPQLRLAMTPLSRRADPAVELACFRIAQEALTNVLRHSGARHATLALHPDESGDHLHLEVADDGTGFGAERAQGLGLGIMRERARQLGGTLRMDSGPEGTRVTAVLPMQALRASG